MRILKTLALYVALGPLFVLGQSEWTNSDTIALIARVKQTPASQLDSKLPNVAFEEWLLRQVGSDASVGWAVRAGEGHGLPWVEADISVEGRPAIVIMIAGGRPDSGADARSRFLSLQLVRKNEFAEWPHLHDLPAAMRRARNGQG